MTKERPILFSAPMVKAILDGSKTQTRIIIRPQPRQGTRAFPCEFGSKGDVFAVGSVILEITDIRVERLQDISEEDARAEGITDGGCLDCGGCEPCGCDDPNPCAVEAFIGLWQSLYGSDSWYDNPWVFVIKFRDISAIGSGEAFARGGAK